MTVAPKNCWGRDLGSAARQQGQTRHARQPSERQFRDLRVTALLGQITIPAWQNSIDSADDGATGIVLSKIVRIF